MSARTATSLEALQRTMSEEAFALLATAIRGAFMNFVINGTVLPILLVIDNYHKLSIHPTPMHNKDNVAAVIRALRKETIAMALVHESWKVRTDKEHYEQDMEMAATVGLEDHPNRTEVVSVSFYVGKRTVLLEAPISRNPNKLGEFKVMDDTTIPSSTLSGRFVDV